MWWLGLTAILAPIFIVLAVGCLFIRKAWRESDAAPLDDATKSVLRTASGIWL